MGSACIIKGRMQRNNTDPLGCAAAPFSEAKVGTSARLQRQRQQNSYYF